MLHIQIILTNANYSNICLYGASVNYAKCSIKELLIDSRAVWIKFMHIAR